MTEETIDEGIEAHASSDRFTPAEKVALRYSELMGTAPDKIDAALYDELAVERQEARDADAAEADEASEETARP